MNQIKVYNQEGNVAGEMEAPNFLTAPWNAALVHQVFKALAANLRRPTAHTKNRGEVSGGGKKPWRQKGTGRARHGSIRSPLWKGGGVTFGPRKEKNFSQKINKDMARAALASAFSKKLANGELRLIKELNAPDLKTKNIAGTVKNLTKGQKSLLVVSEEEKSLLRPAANISNLRLIFSKNANVYDVLNNKLVLLTSKALKELPLKS